MTDLIKKSPTTKRGEDGPQSTKRSIEAERRRGGEERRKESGTAEGRRAPIFKSRRGSQAVKVSDNGWSAMSSWPVPLKTRRVGARCTLNLSRAQTSSRWCCVVAIRVGASPGVVLVTCPRFKIRRAGSSNRWASE
ncbi:hypothetical protein TNCV_4186861 [Trichonephila clavipes]|nr:hypothetical protein TNCV_4186861 [Trichonephila clavipes]